MPLTTPHLTCKAVLKAAARPWRRVARHRRVGLAANSSRVQGDETLKAVRLPGGLGHWKYSFLQFQIKVCML